MADKDKSNDRITKRKAVGGTKKYRIGKAKSKGKYGDPTETTMDEDRTFEEIGEPKKLKNRVGTERRRLKKTESGDEVGVAQCKTPQEQPPKNLNFEIAVTNYVSKMQELGCEGLLQFFREKLVMTCPPSPQANPSFMANPDKNRYQDVVCLENTRVILKYNVPPMTDYIHANWIKFAQFDRHYIATQSPLDNTQGDFWRMVFQEEVPVILNLTKNVEDGKIKGSQYWPLEVGDAKQCGDMFVMNKKVKKEADNQFTITVLEVLPEGCSNSHVCRLFHFMSWPDQGIASSFKSVLKMIRLIRKEDVLASGPVVLHCSAGVGRTGCIVLIDFILNFLFSGQVPEAGVDFVDIFTQMRSQRASSIQNDKQFLFSIIATLLYIRCRAGKNHKIRVDIDEIIENYKKIKF